MNSYVGMTKNISKLEFQRTHTMCALSMHFQQSIACAAITALQLLVFCTALVCNS